MAKKGARRGTGGEPDDPEKATRSLKQTAASPPSSPLTVQGGEDPFLLLAGGIEGGFMSLEEIEEVDFGAMEKVSGKDRQKKKRKQERSSDSDAEVEEGGEEEEDIQDKKSKKNKRGGKKWNKRCKSVDSAENKTEKEVTKEDGSLGVHELQKDETDDEQLLGDDEIYAWKELRLHPLLLKSVQRLGFKEPTAIQKACIPAASHQGKDVIGAAETGSGKTLAFGFPILQRLLEEREKDKRLLREDTKSDKKAVRESPLRALIVAPTRELALQVCTHLKQASKFLDILTVPIVGGMSSEKQERLLRRNPEIVVGTPGRLWELMSAGEQHLAELHSLSFFVLDEADRMIENGHFHELQSIVDMLPVVNGSINSSMDNAPNCETLPILPKKKRQTFVFSATIALSDNFRKKLKRGFASQRSSATNSLSSIEALSERAGIRPDAAIIDLTNASVMANKLEESFIECSDEDKDAYLYYILSVHGIGRTIIFCTSITAAGHCYSLLRILGINAWNLHARRQQRARLKAIDRFRENENAVLVASDVAARGLDIPHVRTVIHYQLPHTADVYVHRSGRTARASSDGCSILLISPGEKTKFYSLCKSLSKESFRQFPVDATYMPEVMKRLSLARQINKIASKDSHEKADNSWFRRNAELVGLSLDDTDNEEDRVKSQKCKKKSYAQLSKLQQDLKSLLEKPLQPITLSRRFFAGAGVPALFQQQSLSSNCLNNKKSSVELDASGIFGKNRVEPLHALRNFGQEISFNDDKRREMQRLKDKLKKQKMEEKKRIRDQNREVRKEAKRNRR